MKRLILSAAVAALTLSPSLVRADVSGYDNYSRTPSVSQNPPAPSDDDRYLAGEIAAIDRAYERGAIDWDQKVRLKCAAYSAAGQMSADFKGCN